MGIHGDARTQDWGAAETRVQGFGERLLRAVTDLKLVFQNRIHQNTTPYLVIITRGGRLTVKLPPGNPPPHGWKSIRFFLGQHLPHHSRKVGDTAIQHILSVTTLHKMACNHYVMRVHSLGARIGCESLRLYGRQCRPCTKTANMKHKFAEKH